MRKKIKFIGKEKFTIDFLLFIIYLIALYPLTKIGFTVSDDMDTFLVSGEFAKQFNLGFFYACLQGRFYNILTRWIYTLPYIVDSSLYFKAIFILPFVSCFILFIKLIQRVVNNSSFTLFCAISIASYFQIVGFYSITTAYPFFFTFSFCLVLISFHLMLSFYQNNKFYLLILSSITLFISALFYESYLCYFFIPFIISLWKNNLLHNKTKQNINKVLKELSPFIICLSLYIIVYFGFRAFYPTQYWGSKIPKDLSFFKAIKSATQLGFYSLPLKVYSEYKDLLNVYSLSFNNIFNIFQVDLIYYIQGIIISGLSFYSLNNYKRIDSKKIFYFFLVGICLYYLPLLPLCISSKYFDNDIYNYVPTFLSLFGVVVSIASLVLFILNKIQKNKIINISYILFVCVSIFFISILTNGTNRVVAKDLEYSNYRLKIVKDIFKNDLAKDINNSPICLEQANQTTSAMGKWITGQEFSWNKYIKRVSSKDINAYDKYNTFYDKYKNSDTMVWVAFSRQAVKTDDILMFFAELKGNTLPKNQIDIVSNRIIVFYLSPYKHFSVSLTSKNNDSVYINNIAINSLGTFHSANILFDLNKEISCFEIKGEDLIASSFNISNILTDTKDIRFSQKTEKEKIEELVFQIENDPKWLKLIEEKAKKNGNTIKKQTYLDAQWTINHN